MPLSLLGGALLQVPMLIPALGPALKLLGVATGASVMIRLNMTLVLQIALVHGRDIDSRARLKEMAAIIAASALASGTSLLPHLHFFNAKPRPDENKDLLDRLNTWRKLRSVEYGTTENGYADDLIEVNGKFYQIRDKQVGIDTFGADFQEYPTRRHEAKKFIGIMKWITYLEGQHQRQQLLTTRGELPATLGRLVSDPQAITALKLEGQAFTDGYLKKAKKLSVKRTKMGPTHFDSV